MAELENVVEPHVDDINKLMIAGFKAYSYNARGLRQQRDVALEYVNANLTRDIPVLDHFDELYSYLCLLYEVGEPKAFEKAANLIESLTEKTTMMYLKQKVIALKIKFYRDQNREEENGQRCCPFSCLQCHKKGAHFLLLLICRSLPKKTQK